VLGTRSVERALASGVTPELCAALFEKFGAPLPATARALIVRLARNYGRVRLYENLTVIEFSDDLALRELLASTSLAKHVIHQISPRVVAVRDEAMDGFFNELVARGHTPRMIAAEGGHG
jgi:hypothetical protein